MPARCWEAASAFSLCSSCCSTACQQLSPLVPAHSPQLAEGAWGSGRLGPQTWVSCLHPHLPPGCTITSWACCPSPRPTLDLPWELAPCCPLLTTSPIKHTHIHQRWPSGYKDFIKLFRTLAFTYLRVYSYMESSGHWGANVHTSLAGKQMRPDLEPQALRNWTSS